MIDEGSPTGLKVLFPEEIEGEWHALSSTAESWASEAQSVSSEIDQAQTSWQGLVDSYQDTGTQEVVHSAMDDVPSVVQDWASAVSQAADVIHSFATEASGLQQQAGQLKIQGVKLQALAIMPTGSSEDSWVENAINAHNSDVLTLNSSWSQLCSNAVSDINALGTKGGLEEDIPQVTGAGGHFDWSTGQESWSDVDISGAAPLMQMLLTLGNPSERRVIEASELYETVMSDGATGEDVQHFYDHLQTMSASEIEDFADQNPQINQYSLPQPSNEEELASWPTGSDGAHWWGNLDRDQQNAMLAALPLMTGNVQGVPYSRRNLANQNALDDLRASDDITGRQRKHLDAIHESLNRRGEAMLLSLNMGQPPASGGRGLGPPPDDPLAAVSVGNPDTADTTTFNVPGMNSNTADMGKEVDNAERLHSALENGTQDHAVVSWVGYDSPGYKTVFRDEHASDGQWALAYELDGYRETMDAQGKDTTANVNAHSYATNTAARALTVTTHDVDNYTMYGSAGIPKNVVEHASELNVAQQENGEPAVYATDAAADGWSGVGRSPGVRQDPTDEDFGAHTFSSDGMGYPPGYPVGGHGQSIESPDEYGYLDRDSQAFESIIRIMDGRGEEIGEIAVDVDPDYYEYLFDEHIDEVKERDDWHHTYVDGYDVTIGGETERVDTRGEAIAKVNEYHLGEEYRREALQESIEPVYKPGFRAVPGLPRTIAGYTVTLGGEVHAVGTLQAAEALVDDFYADDDRYPEPEGRE